jgi:hypothetical protein
VSSDDFLPPYELYLDYFTIGGDRSPGKCEVRGAGREWEWFELMGWGLDGASLILRRRLLLEFEIDVTIATQADLNAWDVFEAKWLINPAAGMPAKTSNTGNAAATAVLNSAKAKVAAAQADLAAPGLSNAEKEVILDRAQRAQGQIVEAQDALNVSAANAAGALRSVSRGLGIYHPRLARALIGSAVVKKVGQWVQSRTGGETINIRFKEYRAPKFIATKPNGTIPGATKGTPRSKDALDEAIDVETQRNKALTAADASLGKLL